MCFFIMRVYPTCFYPWPLFSLAALMSCTLVCMPERKILQVIMLDSFTFPNKKNCTGFTRERPTKIENSGLPMVYGSSQLTTGSIIVIKSKSQGRIKNSDLDHIRDHVRTVPYPVANMNKQQPELETILHINIRYGAFNAFPLGTL
jgi:hypothetical protein